MTARQRKIFEARLDGVAHRNSLRAAAREYLRRRRKLLDCLRHGKIPDYQTGIEVIRSIGLDMEVLRPAPFGVTIIRCPGCPTVVFGPDDKYIGKDFIREQRGGVRVSKESGLLFSEELNQ